VEASALDLATLWRELVAGNWFAVSGFCSETHCFLEVESRKKRPNSARRQVSSLIMLEQTLTGDSPKAIAIDASLSRSTVATRCADGLRALSAERSLSRVPMLIIMAAHAARGLDLGVARVEPVAGGSADRFMLSCERPDCALRPALTEAECQVTRLLIEGRTHAQMARIRNKSPRTIANQLASSFRKLGATGRTALVSRLLRQRVSPANAYAE
jgi:DNA-binding CsgD family transcriptional regulator